MEPRHLFARPVAGVALGAVLCLGTGACSAKVNQDVFEREVAEIHGQLTSLDSRVNSNTTDIQLLADRLDALEADLEDMREEFDVAVTRLENGIRFVTPVHFDFDRADIRSADAPLLDRFSGVIREHYEGALITVEGFADPAGSAAYNRHLSEQRARAVATYLRNEGTLPPEVFRVVGYGEERLVAPGAQGPGNAGIENRRVTFVIEYAPEMEASDLTAMARDG